MSIFTSIIWPNITLGIFSRLTIGYCLKSDAQFMQVFARHIKHKPLLDV